MYSVNVTLNTHTVRPIVARTSRTQPQTNETRLPNLFFVGGAIVDTVWADASSCPEPQNERYKSYASKGSDRKHNTTDVSLYLPFSFYLVLLKLLQYLDTDIGFSSSKLPTIVFFFPALCRFTLGISVWAFSLPSEAGVFLGRPGPRFGGSSDFETGGGDAFGVFGARSVGGACCSGGTLAIGFGEPTVTPEPPNT